MVSEFVLSHVKVADFIPGSLPQSSSASYRTVDVYVSGGKITRVAPATQLLQPSDNLTVVDGTDKLLLPGMVNAHTHSSQQWNRGLPPMLPLEIWLPGMYLNYTVPAAADREPYYAIYLSALHAAVETLMSGGTAIMDHLFVPNVDAVGAAVKAYKQAGIRAFIAPMLGDLPRENYCPIAVDAKERNEKAKAEGVSPGALGKDGFFREELEGRNANETARILALWEEAVQKFHDPDNGIAIAIGPTQVATVSKELMEGAVALRKKYNLAGHIHLLETRAHWIHSHQRFPDSSAVAWLREVGWLSLPGTSCAHSVWLEDEDMAIMAETGAVAVHNPVANLRLGSGIAPVGSYITRGMKVAIGCDGPGSNDGQDLLEAVKLATILNPLTTPEYRHWLTPSRTLKLAMEGGATALGLEGSLGKIEEGYLADMVLYDLTALSLLPRTDPVGLLVLGRPTGGPGGNALHSAWVRGTRVIEDGTPTAVDLQWLRKELIDVRPSYGTPADVTGIPNEVEYRASLGLDGKSLATLEQAAVLKALPKYRLNYDADI